LADGWGWQELAAAASQEKDSEKLRALVDELIQARTPERPTSSLRP